MTIHTLETERLVLRQWQTSDLEPFARLNADSLAMQYFPSTLNEEESNSLAKQCSQKIERDGWGPWALEIKAKGDFVGFTGLNIPEHDFHFSPCTEIAWRLLPEFWGKGFVTEAAFACLKFAFGTLNLDEIVSFTTKNNQRSRAVMERIGMQNTEQDFFHPALEKSHALAEHVLYKIRQEEFSR